MNVRDAWEKLRAPTANALARSRRQRFGSGEGAALGAVVLWPETAAQGVFWAVIEDDAQNRRYLIIAADGEIPIGIADVAVPGDEQCGALSLRCDVDVWLDAERLQGAELIGWLSDEILSQVEVRREASREPSEAELETENDPEYREWRDQTLPAAQRALVAAYPESWSGLTPEVEPEEWILGNEPLEMVVEVGADSDLDAEIEEKLILQILADLQTTSSRLERWAPAQGAAGAKGRGIGGVRVSVIADELPQVIRILIESSRRQTEVALRIRATRVGEDQTRVGEDQALSVEDLDPHDLEPLVRWLRDGAAGQKRRRS